MSTRNMSHIMVHYERFAASLNDSQLTNNSQMTFQRAVSIFKHDEEEKPALLSHAKPRRSSALSEENGSGRCSNHSMAC